MPAPKFLESGNYDKDIHYFGLVQQWLESDTARSRSTTSNHLRPSPDLLAPGLDSDSQQFPLN